MITLLLQWIGLFLSLLPIIFSLEPISSKFHIKTYNRRKFLARVTSFDIKTSSFYDEIIGRVNLLGLGARLVVVYILYTLLVYAYTSGSSSSFNPTNPLFDLTLAAELTFFIYNYYMLNKIRIELSQALKKDNAAIYKAPASFFHISADLKVYESTFASIFILLFVTVALENGGIVSDFSLSYARVSVTGLLALIMLVLIAIHLYISLYGKIPKIENALFDSQLFRAGCKICVEIVHLIPTTHVPWISRGIIVNIGKLLIIQREDEDTLEIIDYNRITNIAVILEKT